jgi:uncharacterized protein
MILALALAALCVWGALCLTFWQGSWQLLYHPKSAIAQRPTQAGLLFDPVDFAPDESGQSQLNGWWIPAGPDARFTVICLHGAEGNISDLVPALVPLHALNLNLLVFDYRGYGESRFARPSERRWREDAESAILYLTGTRHHPAQSLLLIGSGLGANLAVEVAAAHPQIAGVILENPLEAPEDFVLNDPRARLVPAHWLVCDRWDLLAAAKNLHVPSLWLESAEMGGGQIHPTERRAFDAVPAVKMRVLRKNGDRDSAQSLAHWLEALGDPRPAR